tara:strand:+ start:531 stop:1079 length:549 start_codon:yes stop_codon:yes gene_type:complete
MAGEDKVLNFNKYTIPPPHKRLVGGHYICSSGNVRKWNGKQFVRTSKQEKQYKRMNWSRKTDAEQADIKHANKVKWIQRTYGMTEGEYDSKWRNQRGCCPLCNKELLRWHDDTCVDHTPGTGTMYIEGKRVKSGLPSKNRSLLCRKCNLFMELVDDDSSICDRAVCYKEFWRRHHLKLAQCQ